MALVEHIHVALADSNLASVLCETVHKVLIVALTRVLLLLHLELLLIWLAVVVLLSTGVLLILLLRGTFLWLFGVA